MKSVKAGKSALLIVLLSFWPLLNVPAHPVDAVDQTHFLRIEPTGVTVVIRLDFYPTITRQIWAELDTNANGEIDRNERREWLKQNTQNIWLEVQGQRFAFQAAELQVPAPADFLSAANSTFFVHLSQAPLPPLKAPEVLAYVDAYNNLQLNKINLVVKAQAGLFLSDLQAQGGQVRLTLAETGKTFAAILNPESQHQLQASALEAEWTAAMPAPGALQVWINRYLRPEVFSGWTWLLGLGAAFFLGAFHALTPGHGKALVAGYLVGAQGTVLHALLLGMILTVTHTLAVFLLGLAALWLSRLWDATQVMAGLELASAILISGFAAFLLRQRVRAWRAEAQAGPEYQAVPQSRRLLQYLPASDSGRHRHGAPGKIGLTHSHGTHGGAVTGRQLLWLGISGGLVPCPEALAILLVSFALNKVILGLTFLLAFSAGLGVTLVSLGILVVVARQQFSRYGERLERAAPFFSMGSALLVLLLGLFLLREAISHL